MLEHPLDPLHHRRVVAKGLVELEHGEFGRVVLVDAFVAEILADLVDPLEPAGNQPLEIELIGNAQVEGLIERVVVRREWPRRRTAVERLKHRSLDFEVSVGVEILPKGSHQLGANLENAPHFEVGDQVGISLSVAQLDILQPVVLVGRGIERLGQHGHRAAAHGDLARLRAEERARRLDPVAQIEPVQELGEGLFAHFVFAQIELDGAVTVPELHEDRLAHVPDRGDAATDGHHMLGRALTFVRFEEIDCLGGRVRSLRAGGIGFDSSRSKFAHLVQPDTLQVGKRWFL